MIVIINSSGFNLNNSHENGRVFLILDSKQLFRAVHFNLQNEGIYRKLIVISSWKYHFSLGFYKKSNFLKKSFAIRAKPPKCRTNWNLVLHEGASSNPQKFDLFDLIWFDIILILIWYLRKLSILFLHKLTSLV